MQPSTSSEPDGVRPSTPAPKPRRTQAERSASTRQLLLDAAIACLAERGYVATTTTAVVEHAGVSRGAMLHHFRTRQELMRAVGEELLRLSEASLDEAVAQANKTRVSFNDVFAMARDQMNSREFMAAAEILMACRVDESTRIFSGELYERLHRRSNEWLRTWAERGGVAQGPEFEAFLDLMAVTSSGAFLQVSLKDGRRKVASALEQLAKAASLMLKPAGD